MQSRHIFLLFAAVICCARLVAGQPVEPLPKKYTGASIETVLANDRILGAYIGCLMDERPCTKEGNNLKKLLPEAIQSDCVHCTLAQKRNSRKVIAFFRTRRPADWRRLTQKYDPLGQYKETQW